MVKYLLEYTTELTKPLKRRQFLGVLSTGESEAHEIRVTVTRNGEPVELGDIAAYVVRSDMTTVPVTGTAEGNVATVILAQRTYDITGRTQIIVRSTTDDESTTICWIDCNVLQGDTDAIVDPGQVIPDISQLIAKIQEMETKTEAASEAANRANAASESAEDLLETLQDVADVLTNLSATAETLTTGSPATAAYDEETGEFTFGIPTGPVGPQGPKGDTGDASVVTGRSVGYQASQNGTTPPTGTWQSTIPTIGVGEYLWTRLQLTWNDESVDSLYAVVRNGIDGSGAVSSVNGYGPSDVQGNIDLFSLASDSDIDSLFT